MPLHPRRLGLYDPPTKKPTRGQLERLEAIERMYPRPEVDLELEAEQVAKVQEALGIAAVDIESECA